MYVMKNVVLCQKCLMKYVRSTRFPCMKTGREIYPSMHQRMFSPGEGGGGVFVGNKLFISARLEFHYMFT